jgi:hypothetical protein
LGKKTEKDKEMEPGKKSESNTNSKKFLVIIPIIVIVVIALFFILSQNPVEASDEANAQLIIDYGIVEVKHVGGTWSSADNGMLLYQSDSIRTGDNTSASVILFKSSIIRLDSNTEITLREIIDEEETNVTIDQNSGRTWNTVRKISGIDNYEVQTPTTVASVRGTSFLVNVTENGGTSYGVVNGSLNVSSKKNGTIIDTIKLKENESVKIDPDKIFKPLEKEKLKKDEWIDKNLEKYEKVIQEEKAELYKKIEQYIPQIKERYGITDEEIDALIEGYLRGHYKDYDVPDTVPDWILNLLDIV